MLDLFIKLRWKLIKKTIHLAAFLLDPRFIDIPISAHVYSQASIYLKKKSKNNWQQYEKLLIKFRRKENPFNSSHFVVGIEDDPKDCWKYLSMFGEYSGFANLAVRTLESPTGIQGVERSFCSWRRNHTWMRGSLDDNTIEDLVYVYCNLKYLKTFD